MLYITRTENSTLESILTIISPHKSRYCENLHKLLPNKSINILNKLATKTILNPCLKILQPLHRAAFAEGRKDSTAGRLTDFHQCRSRSLTFQALHR